MTSVLSSLFVCVESTIPIHFSPFTISFLNYDRAVLGSQKITHDLTSFTVTFAYNSQKKYFLHIERNEVELTSPGVFALMGMGVTCAGGDFHVRCSVQLTSIPIAQDRHPLLYVQHAGFENRQQLEYEQYNSGVLYVENVGHGGNASVDVVQGGLISWTDWHQHREEQGGGHRYPQLGCYVFMDKATAVDLDSSGRPIEVGATEQLPLRAAGESCLTSLRSMVVTERPPPLTSASSALTPSLLSAIPSSMGVGGGVVELLASLLLQPIGAVAGGGAGAGDSPSSTAIAITAVGKLVEVRRIPRSAEGSVNVDFIEEVFLEGDLFLLPTVRKKSALRWRRRIECSATGNKKAAH